jgi:sulfur-oxidizing protein SoxY
MPGKLNRLEGHAAKTPVLAGAILGGILLSAPALAQDPSWPDLRDELYGSRFLATSDQVIHLDAPYRTDNDARTNVSVRLAAPSDQTLKSVALILDENPMPVSAQFDFTQPLTEFDFTVTMRINGPTPVHAVAELENGQLFMAEGFVKTSGQGACSAPPGTDPEEALATLGQMELALSSRKDTASLVSSITSGNPRDLNLDIDIKHPSHSGMQMDQISLLYIPARYIEKLELKLNGMPFSTMTGSISLSENPKVTLSVPSGTKRVKAILTDTDGTVTEAERSLADY